MSFRKKLVSGVFFTAMSKYVNVIISLVITSILARIMSPEQFGVVAIATVVVTFLSIFSDLGLRAAIIQFKELDKDKISILFSFSIYLGIALSLLVFFSGGYLGEYYKEPLLDPLCKLLSISLFFATISVVPNAIFYREQMFKQIAIRSTIIQLIGGVIAVIWAIHTGGIYALVVSPIISNFLLFVISYSRFPQRFKLFFSVESVSYIFKYSAYQFLFDIINSFSRNIDSLVIGKVLGPKSLGYYDKAYVLMLMPLRNITQVITPVLHPLLNTYRSDSSYLMRVNESIAKLFAVIGFPMSVYCFFVSEELILLFFGDQWYQSIPTFRILSLTVGVQMITASAGSFFQATGNTKGLFMSGWFLAILNLFVILLGAFYFKSIESIAYGFLISYSLCFFQTYWLLYRQVFFTNSLRFFKLMVKPVLFSLLLAVLYKLLLVVIPVEGILLRMIWKTSIYGLAMIAIVFLGGYKEEVLNLVKRKQLPTE